MAVADILQEFGEFLSRHVEKLDMCQTSCLFRKSVSGDPTFATLSLYGYAEAMYHPPSSRIQAQRFL